METEEPEKPTSYTERILDKDENAEKDSKFSETNTATVIRRSHVRVELPAAGLGHRPPSVVSSDQEYPPLEHKEIPVPSPYVKRIQQSQEQAKSKSLAKVENKSNVDTKPSSKDLNSTKPPQDGIYRFQQATVTNSAPKDNQGFSPENNTFQSEVTKEKQSVDLQCQKTVANAKNDQIKVSVREKLAKNKEEVSGKRASFTDFENKADYLDKSNTSTNQYSNNATNQSSNLYKEPSNVEKDVCDKHATFDLLSRNNVEIERASEVTEQIGKTDKVNSSISAGLDKEVEESVQTTWEQEKQKAEMAKLRQTENSLMPGNVLGDKTQVRIASPLRKDLLEDQKVSDNSLIEDSDSSDAKTVTNLESLPSLETQNLNGPVETIKLITSQVVTVTPDTMTPDEAENLLSSR